MKNKKIIIDDINVSECKCYNPNIKMDCSLYPLQPDACKNNPNCYYKQYKRKEQECEGLGQAYLETNELLQEKTKECTNLKAENETLFKAIEEVNKINKRLEADNEELKCTNKIYEQGIARHKDEKNNLKKENNSLKETIDGLLSIQYKLADNCVKYSQTLAEIKEIAEEQQSWNEWNSKHSETESEDDIFAYNCSALKQILQKINECEINNEC